MTKKLKPWTRDTPPNYVGDIEWVMQSPKSGLYVHVYIDEDRDDPSRAVMEEISEALNELWEQRRVEKEQSIEIKHDPMDIGYFWKAANEWGVPHFSKEEEPRTEMRVIELIEYRLDLEEPYIEYDIQYRNDRGPWITIPVTRTQDRERYDRMKGGSDD